MYQTGAALQDRTKNSFPIRRTVLRCGPGRGPQNSGTYLSVPYVIVGILGSVTFAAGKAGH